MELNVIGRATDKRTNTPVIYAQININDYLTLVGDNFDEFEIQRKRENHKAYKRMKADISQGALLPTITLALKPEIVDKVKETINKSGSNEELSKLLKISNQVYILDGLQRTYILRDFKNNEHEFDNDHKLLLEFWVEKEPKHLIYRLIVLNAGQKPMSLRHQLELLFMTMHKRISSEIKGLNLYKEKDETRRSSPKHFSFYFIVTSYHSFQTKNATPNKENVIAQQMTEEKINYATEDEFDNQFQTFKKYLMTYSEIDEKIFGIYKDSDKPSNKNWLAKENVMNSFFAAISDYGRNDEKEERINLALEKLKSFTISDPLGLANYSKISEKISMSKKNIGLMTKKLLKNGFEEFFRSRGEKQLAECWISESPIY